MSPNGVLSEKDDRCISYGEFVVLYGGYEQMSTTVLTVGGISNFKIGNFHHSDIVGKRFGSKIYDSVTHKWVAVLRPTPELLTICMPHRTQILYHADISLILMLLDALPGKRIVESGTGSGSLAVSLARAVAPNGHLYTYDAHEGRSKQAIESFETYGLSNIISSSQRDVYSDGFDKKLEGLIDGVFLDLPAPWFALDTSCNVLQDGGRLVNFSPCIEQVQRLCHKMHALNFRDIRTFELLPKQWGLSLDKQNIFSKYHKMQQNMENISTGDESYTEKVTTDVCNTQKRQKLSDVDTSGAIDPSIPPISVCFSSIYQLPMKSHTGYLTVGTKHTSTDEALDDASDNSG